MLFRSIRHDLVTRWSRVPTVGRTSAICHRVEVGVGGDSLSHIFLLIYVLPILSYSSLLQVTRVPSQHSGPTSANLRCCAGPGMSRTGIFHILFASFFLTLTHTILQILCHRPHHTRSHPFCLLTQFTDKPKTRVLVP